MPIAISFQNESLKGYSLHFTTKNYSVEEIIKGIKLGKPISNDLLSQYQITNAKGYNSLRVNLAANKVILNRPVSTWYHGELGNLPLIKLGLTEKGNSQYVSPVLIEWDLEKGDFNQLFRENYNNIPSLKNKELAQFIIRENKLIEKINPFNLNYSTIKNEDLIFLDLSRSRENYNLLKQEELKEFLLASTNISYEEYLFKTSKLVKLNINYDPIGYIDLDKFRNIKIKEQTIINNNSVKLLIDNNIYLTE